MLRSISLQLKKIIFSLSLIVGIVSLVSAQNKKVIFLTDKNASPFSFDKPEEYLSSRSIDRRKRFNIPLDSTDLPVNPSYISMIENLESIRIIGKSKWMNALIIECPNENTMTQIVSFPFVKTISNVALRKKTNSINKTKTENILSKDLISGRRLNSYGNRLNYGSSYNQLSIHNGQLLHNIGADGQNMIIAFFDSGFRGFNANRSMDSARLRNQFITTRDIVNNNPDVNEDDPHGLYCLSTVAANMPGEYIGSCPKAQYILLRTEDVGSEQLIEEYFWAIGAEYADSCGADVFTSSVGYTTFDDAAQNHTYADLDGNKTIVTIAADKAASKGIFVVTSAGNEGNSIWKYIGTPADGDSVYAVGAIDIQKNIVGYSSFGPTYDGRIKPDGLSVGAGTYLVATDGSIVTANGTSFSTPLLAGLITCLWQLFPEINNATLMQIIREASDRYFNPLPQHGYGIPDMSKALAILIKQRREFTSSITNCKPTLAWKSYDYKGMGYLIQRKMINEPDFSPIDTIFSNDIGWAKRSYSFTDFAINKNATYRIIQLLDTSITKPLSFILDSVRFSIAETCLKNNINLYPNPAYTSFKIEMSTPQAFHDLKVIIYNVSGQQIRHFFLQKPGGYFISPEISTSELQKGIYIIKILDKNRELFLHKLIIQ